MCRLNDRTLLCTLTHSNYHSIFRLGKNSTTMYSHRSQWVKEKWQWLQNSQLKMWKRYSVLHFLDFWLWNITQIYSDNHIQSIIDSIMSQFILISLRQKCICSWLCLNLTGSGKTILPFEKSLSCTQFFELLLFKCQFFWLNQKNGLQPWWNTLYLYKVLCLDDIFWFLWFWWNK